MTTSRTESASEEPNGSFASDSSCQSMVERVARALCERRIRAARKWDTLPSRLAEMLPGSVDHAWRDCEDDARAAIEALGQPDLRDALASIVDAYDASLRVSGAIARAIPAARAALAKADPQ